MEMNEAFCPLYHHAVEVIGRRWSGAIVRAVLAGCTRFGQIRETIPDLSDSMLSARLRELEEEEIVTRTVSGGHPPQVSYALTEKGRELEPVIVALTDWAERWLDPAAVGLDADTHHAFAGAGPVADSTTSQGESA
jgi:DNA-binding HxlR family transcriptional regulator